MADKFTHDSYHHTDGTVCIWLGRYWFVPLDAGGEGYACMKVHHSELETHDL